MCLYLQETEHPQQVCSNETGDFTAKKKSKCTCSHITSTPFQKSPFSTSPQPQLHLLTSTISSVMATGQATFSLILFNEKAPVGFISISSGLWGP